MVPLFWKCGVPKGLYTVCTRASNWLGNILPFQKPHRPLCGSGSLVAKSCPTLATPWSPPGSCVHGILRARILQWVAISFSRGSSGPKNRTQVSYIAGRWFTGWAIRETHRSLCTGDKTKDPRQHDRLTPSVSICYVESLCLWKNIIKIQVATVYSPMYSHLQGE